MANLAGITRPNLPSRCVRCGVPTGLTTSEANDMDPDGIDTTVRYCVGCRDCASPWTVQDVAAAQHEAGTFDEKVWRDLGYSVTEDGEVFD